jgi:glycosyltransferase involved in cell wall biosynthesis
MSAEMKNIIMVLGIGNNERGWAGVMSKYGRVTLIQLGLVTHVEVWENGERSHFGENIKNNPWFRRLDQYLLGLLIFFQTLRLILQNLRGANADIVLCGFYSSGMAALLLQKLGRVRRTVVFLTDYLPPRGAFLVRTHRRLVNWLTGKAASWSDEAWQHTTRIGTKMKLKNTYLMPLPLSQFTAPDGLREEIAYIGYPSYDHGLEILFDIANRHNLRVNIIGVSPYLDSIRHLAPPQTVFHGLLNDEKRIGEILSKCFCGYAIYRDVSPNSYSYYGFPSKTLYCFASNTPVVITNVAEFNESIEKRGVGRIVPPEPEAIEAAILDLKRNYANYSRAIDRFRVEWNAGVEAFHDERIKALS